MQIKWISVPALALCLASMGALKAHARGIQPSSGVSQYQDHPDRWDAAPNAYSDAQRRGFHEGMEAARRDFQERRHADADDHDIYKHPPVEESARKEFREGFREGYQRAMEHMKHDHDYDRDVPRF
jgi:hypothetical protein